jgi:hypothetical protein
MDLTRIAGTAKELFSKIPEALKGFGKAPAKTFTQLPDIIAQISDRFLGHIPEKKRRPILLCFGALIIIFLILIIAGSAMRSRKPDSDAFAGLAAGPRIPPEDLFIPEEPDFIPDFIPGREPRQSWSVDDIRPFWKNPANQGLWRDIIRSEVDKLLEGVP